MFRRSISAGVLALLLTVGVTTSSVAAGDAATAGNGAVMQVSGVGAGQLGPEFPGMEGDPVRFEIDGRATDPLRPSGSFRVVHRKPDGRLLAEFSGRITSLRAVDEVAVVTGVIDAAEHPDVDMEFIGKPVAFTVYDGGDQDRIGWLWGFFGAPVSPLQGTAPHLALTESGFEVRDGQNRPKGNGSSVTVAAKNDGTTVAAVLRGPSPTARGTMRFQLAAHVPAGGTPVDVQGRFRLTDRGTNVEGKLTCLSSGGPVAITTGVVTKSKDPAQVGKPVSFSLKDGRTDRLGWLLSWSPDQPPIADCISTIPSYAPRRGGVVVR
ncbi:hypothetical protein [Kribbella sp. CA-247076]|uniref:hypothetical protein n=1 Tax=Kribbella sp. CA-247076 TaxID=3239941 RepID=UPI003D8A0712